MRGLVLKTGVIVLALWPVCALASQTFSAQPTSGTLSGSTLVTTENANEDALRTSFSGTSAPATPEAGQFFYNTNSGIVQQYNGSAWVGLGVTLGTTAAATNPQRSGQADSGIYSATAGHVSVSVDVSGTGTQALDIFNGGINIPSGSVYEINGVQITCSALSNSASGCSTATGTSGSTIPLNNGGFTQSGTANFTGTFEIGGTAQTFPSSGLIVGTTDTQTLTNKTLSGPSWTATGTGADTMPVGTTGQRPGSPASGMLRYNSTTNMIEGYINAAWTALTTGGPLMINVQAWPYGAACNGSTDDDTAITDAEDTGLPVFIPATSSGCAIKNHVPVAGTTYVGTSAPLYSTTSPGYAWSHFVPVSGATSIFDLQSGIDNVTWKYLDILCSSSGSYSDTIIGITGGGTGLALDHASIRFCGDGGWGDTTYTTEDSTSQSSIYYGNGHANTTAGIINTVDTHFNNDQVTANDIGVYEPSGANDNTFTGVRVEWSISHGYELNGAARNNIIGGTVDANTNCGIFFDGSGTEYNTVNGTVFSRNGSAATYGDEAHICFNGGESNNVLTGIVTTTEGDSYPAYSIFFNSNSTNYTTITGGDYSGYATGAAYYNGYPSNLVINGANGLNNTTAVCHFIYNFSVDGGSVSTITPATNCAIPAKAVFVAATLNATTAVTSSGSATVAVGTNATGGSTTSFLAATGKSSFTSNALLNGVTTYAAPAKVTSTGSVTVTIGTAALTAGVIEGWLVYYQAAN